MGIQNRSGPFGVGDTTVHRLGLGAMRLTGADRLGPPEDLVIATKGRTTGACPGGRRRGHGQNKYNVANHDEADVLSACENLGIGFIPYFPLAAGDVVEMEPALDDVAEQHDTTPSQIALPWLLQHSPAALPIPVTSSVAHLEENVAASAIELSDEGMKRLGG